MKITALSDMHGHLPEIGDADLVLIAGDICCHGNALQQMRWLDTELRRWLDSIEAPVIGVAGNHDWPFFGAMYPPVRKQVDEMKLPWTYLEDSGVEHEGFKTWGTRWQPEFYNWAFNLTEQELSEKWKLIPEDTDILICHGPPNGFGDFVDRPGGGHVGSPSLTERIAMIQPQLVVFGHIHCGRGNWTLGGSQLANVTVVNEGYEMVHDPYEITLSENGRG